MVILDDFTILYRFTRNGYPDTYFKTNNNDWYTIKTDDTPLTSYIHDIKHDDINNFYVFGHEIENTDTYATVWKLLHDGSVEKYRLTLHPTTRSTAVKIIIPTTNPDITDDVYVLVQIIIQIVVLKYID